MIEHFRTPPLWEPFSSGCVEAILSGELTSGGQARRVDLAERFGTSRGPIREAIRELVREGLVVEFARRGNVVSTLTARDLAEVYGVREALEVAASRLAVERADEQLCGCSSSTWWRSRAEQVSGYLANSAHDLAFHRTLVALAGNHRMTEIYEQMLTQTAHLLRTAAEANPTLQTTIRPSAHRDILDALGARDADRAREAIEAHYRYAEERLFPGLER